MRYKVWRSLDQSASFLGIKGNYIMLFALTLVPVMILTVAVGGIAGQVGGLLTFCIGGAADYLLILTVQARMSEKAFKRSLLRFRRHRHIKLHLQDIESIINTGRQWKERTGL